MHVFHLASMLLQGADNNIYKKSRMYWQMNMQGSGQLFYVHWQFNQFNQHVQDWDAKMLPMK